MLTAQYYSHTVPQYHSTTVHSTYARATQSYSTTVPQYHSTQYSICQYMCYMCIHVSTAYMYTYNIQHVTSSNMYACMTCHTRTHTHARARARGSVLCTVVLWYCMAVLYCVLWCCGTVCTVVLYDVLCTVVLWYCGTV